MQIDWITVSAQIVNFLILVWLLKRFLYKPVTQAMDQREREIAKKLESAQQREHEAEETIQRYDEKSDELEHKSEQILAEAEEDAEERKKQLLNEARTEFDEKRENWQRQFEQEQEDILDDLRQQLWASVKDIARSALRDMADTGLEEQLVDAFIKRLKSLDKKARKALADASGPVRIGSSLELESTVRGRLTRAVHEHLVQGVEVDYEQSEELLCGIQLRRGNQRMSWSLAEYMEELEAGISRAFSSARPDRVEEA